MNSTVFPPATNRRTDLQQLSPLFFHCPLRALLGNILNCSHQAHHSTPQELHYTATKVEFSPFYLQNLESCVRTSLVAQWLRIH